MLLSVVIGDPFQTELTFISRSLFRRGRGRGRRGRRRRGGRKRRRRNGGGL